MAWDNSYDKGFDDGKADALAGQSKDSGRHMGFLLRIT
jgi:hypothetical protein